MKILLCEDEDSMRRMIKKFLVHEGYQVYEAADGEAALVQFYQETIDLVILDWMMPKIDGLEVARQMKQERNVKILMLTAKNLPEDEVKALVSGVDDYLAKPFHAEVLLVRVAKLLGMIQAVNSPFVLFPKEKRLQLRGTEISLTKKEFDLIYYLYQNQGLALTREQLLLSVWGMDNENDERTVDSFIRSLRDKLGKEFIQTVYGTGYRFELPEK